MMTAATLSSERRQQLDNAFIRAKDLLSEPSPYWHVPIPVPIPSMARKVAGEILGWPLHLRNKPMDEDGQTAVVMPVMRHKPLGVSLLPSQPRVPKMPPAESSKMGLQQQPAASAGESANNPFALRAAFEAPAAAAPSALASATPQENFIGARVRKHFDGKDLEGSVIREDNFAGGKFYFVLYDDGNQEHLTPHELTLRKL